MIRKLVIIASAAVVAFSGLTACSSSGSDSDEPQQGSLQGFQDVPVTLKELPAGIEPLIQVTIGNSQPLTLVLDTGSPGLRVISSALQDVTGINQESATDTVAFGDGTQFTGHHATAQVSVGSNPTKGPIQFQVITDLGCTAAKPKCLTAGGAAALQQEQGAVGFLGASNLSDGKLFSPLLQLQNGLPDNYTLRTGSENATLSFDDADPSALATFPMATPASTANPNGSTNWNDLESTACWAIGEKATPTCLPTAFDTGTDNVQLTTAVPGAPAVGKTLPKTAVITLTDPTGPGSTTPKPGSPAVITGMAEGQTEVGETAINDQFNIAALYLLVSYDVTWDIKNGNIQFASQQDSGANGDSPL